MGDESLVISAQFWERDLRSRRKRTLGTEEAGEEGRGARPGRGPLRGPGLLSAAAFEWGPEPRSDDEEDHEPIPFMPLRH
jgi:hypothetical protein